MVLVVVVVGGDFPGGRCFRRDFSLAMCISARHDGYSPMPVFPQLEFLSTMLAINQAPFGNQRRAYIVPRGDDSLQETSLLAMEQEAREPKPRGDGSV